ncbi:MAG: hypothetical protein FD145_1221 [Candidatus Saganbacteria bacterium]|uniref:tRNA threonylcarbamoyladenosine biosynthesis protein TsaE n=1 Tax=Candidatus Saganbacteria bacterium TaxID=2575572 RepID=A0A833L0B7_UNCSA|nr:MAG: hypothetical protein FD145_1221 [Candidatus Saganbacteria bacterium]
MKSIVLKSPQETLNLGEKIGFILKPNDILLLTGELGAGKTTFVQGIAKGLNVKDFVTSPSYSLINEYEGTYHLFHIDLYRLETLSQIEELGITEYFLKDGVTIIEWAEKMENLLPKNGIRIKIEYAGENKRKIWLPLEFQALIK